jgi:hypothetical protein
MMAAMRGSEPGWDSRRATRRATRRTTRGAALLALLVLAVSSLASCTGDDDPAPPEEEQQQQAALELSLVGRPALDAREGDDLQSEVGDAVTAYVVGGFLGDHPRDDFVRSLDAFTSGAAQSAAEDLDILTASDYAGAEAVDARQLVARITPFAPEGEVLGATAAVDFRFVVTDEAGEQLPLALTGRLMLVPERGGWRIFGYDVTRDDGAQQREGSSS